jgi:ABC-2 type transport system permease protein
MSQLGLIVRQARFTNKAFWRNPAAAFFTIAFPLLFLVLFTTIFGGNGKIPVNGHQVSVSTFYVPAIITFSVITACYTNIAMNLTFAREQGILKRIKGTPLPGRSFLLGRLLHAVLIALLLTAICFAFGAAFYDATIPGKSLAAFVFTLAIGSASFCCLGMAATTIIPNADAAPAIVNASILPLLFVSDVFIPLQHPPAWLDVFSKIFPIRHFSQAMQYAFFPPAGGSGLKLNDLLIVAAWGLFGLVVSSRRFTWEPRK